MRESKLFRNTQRLFRRARGWNRRDRATPIGLKTTRVPRFTTRQFTIDGLSRLLLLLIARGHRSPGIMSLGSAAWPLLTEEESVCSIVGASASGNVPAPRVPGKTDHD